MTVVRGTKRLHEVTHSSYVQRVHYQTCLGVGNSLDATGGRVWSLPCTRPPQICFPTQGGSTVHAAVSRHMRPRSAALYPCRQLTGCTVYTGAAHHPCPRSAALYPCR
ncbi:PREDICTED: uncharacterized protein LOC105448747 [Wasmannia auropunctata]|uniref:uncharacterized protein LOC105448747 n=1 Tax=Wasmannia auropunctata TaxID=64793 RepID=UPI0005EFA504|nr:PREDICTED: uncharacterized protein LOC105448747 [Wasmannia auropunctata]